MKPQPFAHTLALALGRTGRTDKQFSQDAGMPASALSSYKIGRNFPPPARMSQILGQFKRRPRDYHALLTAYLLDCSPTGYRADLARLLEGVNFLDLAQVAEDSTKPDQDQEIEAALATRKKHVRDLLDLIGKSPIKSGQQLKYRSRLRKKGVFERLTKCLLNLLITTATHTRPMTTKAKSSRSKSSESSSPACAFCKRSGAGVQFAIFNPRFKPFGTACTECEATLPADTPHPLTIKATTPTAL